MDDDDDVDEDAYDLSTVARPKQDEVEFGAMRAAAVAASSATTTDDGPAPQWAAKWKSQQARPRKLTGLCVTWNAKGFGFVKRDDGLADLYVHQRDLYKKGFRSLKVGERLEFDVAAMDDGRLHAVNVTGPAGVEVVGQRKPGDSDEDEEDDDEDKETDLERAKEGGAGGKAPKADSGSGDSKKPYSKPALAFKPRTIKRPVPKAGGKSTLGGTSK